MQVPNWRGSPAFLIALLTIIAASAAVRVYLFRGYVGLDDAEYARLAYQMAHGTFSFDSYAGPAVFPLRIGLTAPTALLFRLFGLSEWTAVLYPLLLSLACIALAYVCSSLLFGPRAGLIAAALLGIFPWDLESATNLLADLPSAFYATTAVTLVIFLERTGVQRRAALFGGGLIAGVALGFSWLCKETVAYMAPFWIALMVTTVRTGGSRWLFLGAGVAVGSLSILFGEMITYHHFTGDLFFRFQEIERNYGQNDKYFFAEGSRFGWDGKGGYSKALFDRLLVTGPAVILLNRSFLFLPLIGLAATAYGWFRRDRSFLIPGLWLWTLVLMFNFCSSSLTSYAPLALFQRYLYPIYFPSIVLVSGLLARTLVWQDHALTGRTGPMLRWAAVLTTMFLTWVGGTNLLYNLKNPPTSWAFEVRTMKNLVQSETVLYGDTLTLRAFEFFAGYPLQTSWKDFEAVESVDEIAEGSVVLVNKQYIKWLDRNGGIWNSKRSGYRSHSFYSNPPPFWTPIWKNGNASLYRVNRPADGPVL